MVYGLKSMLIALILVIKCVLKAEDVNHSDILRKRTITSWDLQGRNLAKFTKEEIDIPCNVEENSELELLLESFSCKGSKAIGIHPELRLASQVIDEEEYADDELQKSKRNFIPPTTEKDGKIYSTRWENGIVPYVIKLDTFDCKYRRKVLKVLRGVEDYYKNKTCIRLQRKTLEEIDNENITNYVYVYNDKKKTGCWSKAGRYGWSKGQPLHLKQTTAKCLRTGTAIHEFGHAIGMKHEQSRKDRDNHIYIDFSNVKKGKVNNFKKFNTTDRNPYDYQSIMQYSLKSFVKKSWRDSIHFRNPELEFLAGQRIRPSFYDVMDVTKVYNCTENCIPKECLNGGFLYHTCECFCPEGLTGPRCENIASDCGRIIDLETERPVTIRSPNYPDKYDTGKICYWLLRATNSDDRVMIEIEDFDLSSNDELGRCYHWLEVRYNLIGQSGPKYCCNGNMRNKISTTKFGNSHLMMLIFDSATVSGAEPSKGFEIKAYAVKPRGCSDDPPNIPNAVIVERGFSGRNNSYFGAIIEYKCLDEYQVVGDNFVNCEADGTWSKPRFECVQKDPLLECSFDYGYDCDIVRPIVAGTYHWNMTYYEGESFMSIQPEGKAEIEGSKKIYVRFRIEHPLEADKTYCLQFRFRRYNNDSECAALFVGNSKFDYYPWKYYECKEMEWTLFKGDFGPLKQDMDIEFSAKAYRKHENFNMDIDDIKVKEGSC